MSIIKYPYKNVSLELFKPNILFLQKYLCKSHSSKLLIYNKNLDFYCDNMFNKFIYFKENSFFLRIIFHILLILQIV